MGIECDAFTAVITNDGKSIEVGCIDLINLCNEFGTTALCFGRANITYTVENKDLTIHFDYGKVTLVNKYGDTVDYTITKFVDDVMVFIPEWRRRICSPTKGGGA